MSLGWYASTLQAESAQHGEKKIPIDAILFPIELTSSSRIPSAIKEKLKKAYELKRAH